MTKQFVFAGFGGQGMLLIGKFLAMACMLDGTSHLNHIVVTGNHTVNIQSVTVHNIEIAHLELVYGVHAVFLA